MSDRPSERESARETEVEKALSALTALGEAWRGDWNHFDGRQLRLELEQAAATIRKAASGESVTGDVADLYATWGVCPEHRCWVDYCDERHE